MVCIDGVSIKPCWYTTYTYPSISLEFSVWTFNPMTAIADNTEWEQGKFHVFDSIAKYLPELDNIEYLLVALVKIWWLWTSKTNQFNRHLLIPLYFTLCWSFFLCGENKVSGQTFEYHRGWAEDRLLSLVQYLLLIPRPPYLCFCSNEQSYFSNWLQTGVIWKRVYEKHFIMLP